MKNLPRILIVGGFKKDIPDKFSKVININHVDRDHERNGLPASASVYEAVVVIRRFCKRQVFELARELANTSKVPFIACATVSKVLEDLEKTGVIVNGNQNKGKVKGKEVEEGQEVKGEGASGKERCEEAARSSRTGNVCEEGGDSTLEEDSSEGGQSDKGDSGYGKDLEYLWSYHGVQAVEAINELLKPGESTKTENLIEIISVGTGLKADVAVELLPDLCIQGVIAQVGKNSYKRLREGEIITYVEESSQGTEPKKPSPAGSSTRSVDRYHLFNHAVKEHSLYISLLVSGLPEGPYENRWIIWEKIKDCIHFRTYSGKDITRTNFDTNVVPHLKKNGILYKDDNDLWRIKHDPSVVLHFGEAVNREVEAGEVEVKSQEELPPKDITLDDVRSSLLGQPKKIKENDEVQSSVLQAVKDSYGGMIPWVGAWSSGLKRIRKIFPDIYWDELSCRTISRRLKSRQFSEYMQFKEKFSQAEWDFLAYDTLKNLTIETIITIIKEEPVDEVLKCIDCRKDFVYPKSEREFFEKQFGEQYTPPKRCKECRKNK